jgi:diacylglycerol kinase (ATP)
MIRHRTLIKSFGHAIDGLIFALSNDQNLRIHFIAAAVVMVLSLYFRVNPFEMGILGVMIILVISTELINTSIEQMTNLITKEHRQEAKIAKDVSSAMVMVASFGAIIVGILIFVPYFVRAFS